MYLYTNVLCRTTNDIAKTLLRARGRFLAGQIVIPEQWPMIDEERRYTSVRIKFERPPLCLADVKRAYTKPVLRGPRARRFSLWRSRRGLRH